MIRVGLVGARPGPAPSWGASGHVPALRDLPGYELTAICTSRDETAAAAAEQFGVPLSFSDVGTMARHPEVDLVVVAVRAALHRPLVTAALENGADVYCEWPLGADTAEARELHRLAEDAGVRTVVGLQASGNIVLRHVRDLLADGFVGRVLSVSLSVRSASFGPVSPSSHAFTADVDSGSTLLSTNGAQALEAMAYAVSDIAELSAIVATQHPVVRVAETGETLVKSAPDQILLDAVLRNAAVASVHIMGGAVRTVGSRLEVHGSEGDLVLTSEIPNFHYAPLRVEGGRGSSLEPMPLPDAYRRHLPEDSNGAVPSLRNFYEDYESTIAEGRPWPLDFTYAVRRHELLDSIRVAAQTGIRQTVA